MGPENNKWVTTARKRVKNVRLWMKSRFHQVLNSLSTKKTLVEQSIVVKTEITSSVEEHLPVEGSVSCCSDWSNYASGNRESMFPDASGNHDSRYPDASGNIVFLIIIGTVHWLYTYKHYPELAVKCNFQIEDKQRNSTEYAMIWSGNAACTTTRRHAIITSHFRC